METMLTDSVPVDLNSALIFAHFSCKKDIANANDSNYELIFVIFFPLQCQQMNLIDWFKGLVSGFEML